MIAFLLTVALFPSIGLAAAIVIRPLLPATLFGRLGMAFLLGIGSNGVLLFVAGIADIPLTWTVFAAIPLLAALVVAVHAKSLFAGRRSESSPRYPAVATILFVLPFLAVALMVAVLPLSDYDGRVTWLPKAKAIAEEGSIEGPFFRGERGLNLHNHYPLLLPLDAAVLMRLSGCVDDQTVRWLYLLIPVALLAMARDFIGQLHVPSRSAWVIAAVAWLPLLIVAREGGASSAYSDLSVAAFAGGAVLALCTLDNGSARARSAGIWLAFLVLTKNEGAMLTVAILATAAIMRSLQTTREWLQAGAPPAGAMLALTLWRRDIPSAYDEQYGILFRELPRHLMRGGEAARALLSHALDLNDWGFFWPAVLLAAIACLGRASRAKTTLFPIVMLLLSLSGYVAALTVTSWRIAELAQVSADRLFVHLLVPACLILVGGWSFPAGEARTRRTCFARRTLTRVRTPR